MDTDNKNEKPHILKIELWDVDLPTGDWTGPDPLSLFPHLDQAQKNSDEMLRAFRELNIQYHPTSDQNKKIIDWVKQNIPEDIKFLFHGLEVNFVQFQKVFHALPSTHIINAKNNSELKSRHPEVYKDDWDSKLDLSRINFIQYLDSIDCKYQLVTEDEAIDNGMINIENYGRPSFIGSPDIYPGNNNSPHKLWKYLTTTKFVDMIQNQSTWFSLPQYFDDPHEFTMDSSSQRELFQWKLDLFARAYNRAVRSNQISYITASAPLILGLDLDETGIIKNKTIKLSDLSTVLLSSIRKNIRNWQESFCISCWRYSPYDSISIWNQYASLNEGVAVVVDLEGLRKSFQKFGDIRLALIEYKDFSEDTNTPMTSNPLTYKDIRFASEEEARFYFRARLGKFKGVSVPFELSDVIKEIHLPPVATSHYSLLIKRLLDTYGFDIPIVESSLSRIPNKF